MFIDQFTEEQIALIRRELKERQSISKATEGEYIRQKVQEIFDWKSYSNAGLYPCRAVGDAISAIADYAFDNFIYKKQGRAKKQIGWYRSGVIRKDREEEYLHCVDEILDILRKYKTEKEFPLKKENENES